MLVSGSVFAKNVDYFKNSTWLCIEDSGVGYNWNTETSKWVVVQKFKTKKIIVKTTSDSKCNRPKPNSEYREYICGIHYDFGDDHLDEPFFYDYYEALKYRGQSRIKGKGIYSELAMSDTGQFIYSYGLVGNVLDKGIEVEGSTNYKDSMKLSIGKCSKI